MSAFIVGHDHIDGLLTFAVDHKASYYIPDQGRVYIDQHNATEIGRILLTENERSMRERYDDHAEDDAAGYNFREFTEFLNMPQRDICLTVLKACDCFDYQACETDDYEDSLAYRIIDAIRNAAIHALPGYDNARGWELRRNPDAPTVIKLSSLISRKAR